MGITTRKEASKIRYSVICDSCGSLVTSGITLNADRIPEKAQKQEECKITKTTGKVKCKLCQQTDNRKPKWAR